MIEENNRDRLLIGLGDEILAAMGTVSEAAREVLSQPDPDHRSALVRPSNMMVGDAKPERFLNARFAETRADLAKLLLEPFVARVEVEWNPGGPAETYYFARRSASGLTSTVKDARFVALGMALGALAEYEAGEVATIKINDRERQGRILRRAVLSPQQRQGLWNAVLGNFEIEPWGEVIELLRAESLRAGIDGLRQKVLGPVEIADIVGRVFAQAAKEDAERGRLRRKVIERIALRDRPVLDKFQGEIFRLPLDRQVVLFGPPGSGKTTTLVKRLAQKRTADALTDRETSLVTAYNRERFLAAASWAMFSPTELLKEYLGDAFSKEGVPDAGNVRTWERERHDLARNVFGILRTGRSGRYQLVNDTILADSSSIGIAALHDDFAAYAEGVLTERCDEALKGLRSATGEGVKRQVMALSNALGSAKRFSPADILRFLDEGEGWRTEIQEVSEWITAELNKTLNLLLNANRSLLQETINALPTLSGEEDDDTDEDTEETGQPAPPSGNQTRAALEVLMAAVRNWSRAVVDGRRTIGGRSGRVIALIGSRMLPSENFMRLGEGIALRARLRTFAQAPRMSVMGLSTIYARFRRQAVRDGHHFVPGDATAQYLNRNMISADEVDALLLVMLRHSRHLSRYADRRRIDLSTQHDWLATIRSRYLTQVFVDEATDLSAVQLACTVELADPALRSWFAAGDLRQRITANGIRDGAELDWLNRIAEIEIDIRNIRVGYRQSRRLRELSDALAALLDSNATSETEPFKGSEESNAWPLLGERLSGKAAAEWLAARIGEVEDSIGRLPSIAIFVDGDGLIDGLVDNIRPLLATRNIRVAGCKEGKVVGDELEVRIFDVQFIKGLEFEAVFFVGVDRLAERLPELFERFFYVGVTRAATYLGVTCEGVLPSRLKPVQEYFDTGTWQIE